MHASSTLFFEKHSSFEEKNVRSNIRIFERRLYSKSFTAPLPTGCSNANQRRWRQVEASATVQNVSSFEEIIFVRRFRSKKIPPVVGLMGGQLSETTFNLEVEPGRHQEVHRDRLKAEVPCPKGRFKPLYWTSKYLSDRKMVTSSFELEKILDYKKNARNKWYFLCRWKGFGPEEDKWEPASSFFDGYTDTFIKFLKKHPDIDRELSLIKDCVTKEDLQAQEEAPIVAESIRDKI